MSEVDSTCRALTWVGDKIGDAFTFGYDMSGGRLIPVSSLRTQRVGKAIASALFGVGCAYVIIRWARRLATNSSLDAIDRANMRAFDLMAGPVSGAMLAHLAQPERAQRLAPARLHCVQEMGVPALKGALVVFGLNIAVSLARNVNWEGAPNLSWALSLEGVLGGWVVMAFTVVPPVVATFVRGTVFQKGVLGCATVGLAAVTYGLWVI